MPGLKKSNIQLAAHFHTSRLHAGNPAAVCIFENCPEDALLQSITLENNLSETAFLIKQGDTYVLHWFTPQAEMDLCGHATLASAYVIFNFIEPALNQVSFNTLSGALIVTSKGELLQMNFPSLPPQPCAYPIDPLHGLGKHPMATHRAGAYLAVFETEEDIIALHPDAEYLNRLDLPYVIVTAKSKRVDFVSLVFGPKVGITDDPVTGAAHCTLPPTGRSDSAKTPSMHNRFQNATETFIANLKVIELKFPLMQHYL